MSKEESKKPITAVIIIGEMEDGEVMRILKPYYRNYGAVSGTKKIGETSEIVQAYLHFAEKIILLHKCVVQINPSPKLICRK